MKVRKTPLSANRGIICEHVTLCFITDLQGVNLHISFKNPGFGMQQRGYLRTFLQFSGKYRILHWIENDQLRRPFLVAAKP